MDLIPSLELLAEQTLSGIAFVTAYGMTWLICGVLWRRTSARTAAFVTLLQGTVAFPLALGASALLGAIGQARPVADEITQLSVLIGTSPLLGLPLLILFVAKHWYTVVPLAFATLTSMHFVLYSWLYRTPVYIVLAIAVAVGAVAVTLASTTASSATAAAQAGRSGTAAPTGAAAPGSRCDHPDAEQSEGSVRRDFTARAAGRVCTLTGGLLLASGGALGVLHAAG